MIVTGPVFVIGVYVTEHILVLVEVPNCANVHEVESKLPPAPPSSHDIVPVGMIFVPGLGSRTFALNVMGSPISAVAGFGVMVVVEARKFTVKDDVPELVS